MSLPVSLPLGGALALVLAFGIGAFAAGVAVGIRWQAGRTAIDERLDMRRQIAVMEAAAVELRQRGFAVAQDFRTAQIRIETTTEGLNHDLAALDATFTGIAHDMESLLARHPEWDGCRVGIDGMQSWNAAAAGRYPDAAAALDPELIDPTLSGRAADATRGQPAVTDPQLHPGGEDLPPLPLPAAASDASGETL